MAGSVKHWISAFRLRTLPLSLSVIFMGSFLAASENAFRWDIFILAITTTLFLQILSNLANDYGDTENGADNLQRIGPSRAVQSGAISKEAMKRAIIVFSILALVSGLTLIYRGLKGLDITLLLFFVLLGLGCIAAAIKYTAGSNPYGYRGLGDIFVFLFFGWVGVAGSYFLYSHTLSSIIFLPASAMGLLSAGVLNMNNMRDHVSDQQAGKITVVVRMGFGMAKVYQTVLVLGALLCAVMFTVLSYGSAWQWLFLITLPLFAIHLKTVVTNNEPVLLDKQLKILALTTLLFCVTFGVGLLL